MAPKPPQHPRKRACAGCRARDVAIREWTRLTQQDNAMFAALSHALERANQVIDRLPGFREYKSAIDRSFECAELKAESAALRESVSHLEAERDRYRILRDAASEASLRLRVEYREALASRNREIAYLYKERDGLRISNERLEADCAAIRAERDRAFAGYTHVAINGHVYKIEPLPTVRLG